MTTWPYPEDFIRYSFPNLSNIQFITQGGQKAVFSALHPTAGHIALKIICPSDTPERFQREITAVQEIDAPQVPKVLEHGSMPPPFATCYWMTEEWAPGITLRERLIQGALSDQLVILIASSIISTLVLAEKHRIVHRDIKPENIIISPDESRCWLIDFGIARHLDKTSLTGLSMPCTIGYAPIEQLEAHKHEIDTRSDLFSLGVTLYECVEGVNPYIDGASSAQEVVERISLTRLPAIKRQVAGSTEFGSLLESMTHTRRTHRINSAEEAMTWITEIMGLQGINPA